MAKIVEVAPPAQLFRLARPPDPVAWPPLASLELPDEYRSRFDAPRRRVRVLYASESVFGCALEIIGRFRRAPGITDILSLYGEGDLPASGMIPASEFRIRTLGTFAVEPRPDDRFLDLRATETLTVFGVDRSEALSRNRSLTQRIATQAIELGYRGIAYESFFARDVTNWALFEPAEIVREPNRVLDPRTDPEVLRALRVLGVDLG